MRRHRSYIFLLLVLLGLQARSQSTKRYFFTHYGTSAGLASNEIFDVVQDAVGYMWIATNGGLQRFDGVRFITFHTRKNDPSSIPGNYVSQVKLDRNKQLWIISNWTQVGIFDTRSFTFKEVPVKPSKEHNIGADKKIVEDEAGNIFLILFGVEILKYDKAKNEFSVDAASRFFHLPPEWRITGFRHLKGTPLYVFGTSHGTAVFNSQTQTLSHPGDNKDNDPLVRLVGKYPTASNFFEDNQRRLWFDYWEEGEPSLFCYDLNTNQLILNGYSFGPLINNYHELKGMMQQRDGTIWIRGLGVFASYLEKEKRFQLVYNQYENEQSIFYELVTGFYEDNENNIWVTTSNNGLYRFNPREQYFTNIRHINRLRNTPGNGGVMSFMLTRQGTLLAGTWGDGVYRYDLNYNPLPLAIRGLNENDNPSMWSMYASRDSNTIWFGSQPGIWAYDQSTQTAKFYDPPIMKSRTVRQILEDKFGNLWMGMQSTGVFKWTREKGKRNFNDGVSQFTEVPPSMVLKIAADRRGYIWVCTVGLGAYVIDPESDKVIMHIGEKEPEGRKVYGSSVVDMLQYDDSTIIIAARGFFIYSVPQQKIVQTINLPDNFIGSIQAVERDRQGYLWASSTSGLYRVNIRNKIFIHFDRVDGIVNDRFTEASSIVLPDGRIIFGADNQFVAFDPAEVKINNPAPDVMITGFSLMNKPLLVDSLLKRNRIDLKAENNSLSIDLAGLSFNTTYIIKYKMEGLDKDWKTADKNFQAIYSYLPPGTYTFLARSEDAEGMPGNKTTRLVIHISPPFWKSWWFFCLLALGVAAIFYWLDQQRVNKLMALQRVRAEIAANLHEDVNTTLNNINLLSEMARIKADKDINRSKEYIDQISNKSHNMIIAMDDILWSIDPQNDNMEKSLLRMMEFADALKNRHGANIELALDKKVRELKLDMKTRHEVLIIFKETLRMIVQYSSGRETLVHIDLFKNKLSIKLQDATATLDKNTAEIDNCIREINNRAAMIGADLDVQYDRNGIAVILLVPVK